MMKRFFVRWFSLILVWMLAEAAGTGNWLDGMRFSSSVTREDVQAWLESLGL